MNNNIYDNGIKNMKMIIFFGIINLLLLGGVIWFFVWLVKYLHSCGVF